MTPNYKRNGALEPGEVSQDFRTRRFLEPSEQILSLRRPIPRPRPRRFSKDLLCFRGVHWSWSALVAPTDRVGAGRHSLRRRNKSRRNRQLVNGETTAKHLGGKRRALGRDARISHLHISTLSSVVSCKGVRTDRGGKIPMPRDRGREGGRKHAESRAPPASATRGDKKSLDDISHQCSGGIAGKRPSDGRR